MQDKRPSAVYQAPLYWLKKAVPEGTLHQGCTSVTSIVCALQGLQTKFADHGPAMALVRTS